MKVFHHTSKTMSSFVRMKIRKCANNLRAVDAVFKNSPPELKKRMRLNICQRNEVRSYFKDHNEKESVAYSWNTKDLETDAC